jgi:hypothetical protein
MWQLIKKVSLLLLILLIVNLVIHLLVVKSLNPIWGNATLVKKIKYLHQHHEFNTVFIGSSKIHNQIDPDIFDKVTSYKTISFNMGCVGLGIPESYLLLDELFENKNIKYVILEIRSIGHTKLENMHITRNIYYQHPELYLSTLNNALNSNLPFFRKVALFITHTVSFIEYSFNFRLVQGLLDYKIAKDADVEMLYSENKGFDVPADINLQSFKNNPDEISDRKTLAKVYTSNYYKDQFSDDYNGYYLNILQHYADKAKANGITLIFMMPSSMREYEYKEVMPLMNQVKDVEKMMMCDPDKFPELYEVENNLEVDHLNRSGTEFFSTYLGQEFNKISSNQNIK